MLIGEEQRKAFLKLKEDLVTIKTLGYYDPDDRTQVIDDASPVGLGAILIQYDNKGSRIIAHGNKSLTDSEKRYCQTEKEALALVWSIEHFKIYLYGKKFELVTDHKPLQPQEQLFNEEEYIQQLVEYARPRAVTLHEIDKKSFSDTDIQKVKQGLFQNIWDDTVLGLKAFASELCFFKNILLRGNKIVIPNDLKPAVLQAAHEGHSGIVAMKKRLRTKVWWPKIDYDAERLAKTCHGCTLVSAPNPPQPMKRRELPLAPWIDVAVDYMGPLPSGDYLFVVVDYYSRYKEIKIMRNITAASTIKVLQEIFYRLGFPVSLTADNGKQLISEYLKRFCESFDILLATTKRRSGKTKQRYS
ncbi:Transposon Ty3-G Gag-Pol polyprotein-like Protein [Tribolium castaneum]|uniref:RNA-directed DNA polymerase n=1 Tax=Tribolium castaneum TaxID=7070 RepID=D7EKH6_TRICA|nr:Transposon Ty3-G Gag-Pol polyprotein-like Protein [Tribolium castaneum]